MDSTVNNNSQQLSDYGKFVGLGLVSRPFPIPSTPYKDMVIKPAHYNTGEIEAIMYLEDNMPLEAFIGYLEGSVKKYLHRWRYKQNPVQDLEKALWYLARLIWKMQGKMLKDMPKDG